MERLAYPIYIILLIIFVWGCGDEIPDQNDPNLPPRVTSASISEGMTYASNTAIIVTFSKSMEWAEIEISGSSGITTLDASRKVANWRIPSFTLNCGDEDFEVPQNMAPGDHTLTVTGVDIYGYELEAFGPIDFIAVAPD